MVLRKQAIKNIESLISRVDEIRGLRPRSPQFIKWKRDTEVALEHIFGKKSRHISDFKQIRYYPSMYSINKPDHKFEQYYVESLENAEHILISMIDEIQEYWEEDGEGDAFPQEETKVSVPSQLELNKIFIIHGHDAGTKEMVAAFITKLGLEPVILHEKPNQGRTIIEKFEDYSDVGYAIALMTPDDRGSSVKESDNRKHRARQNVIFEFGYFLAKLGREKVVGLVKGDIELPSDYFGVLYIPINDDGNWRNLLMKELKSVGYDIDANRVL